MERVSHGSLVGPVSPFSHYYYDNIENSQRGCNFPLMDCPRKRVLIWDEANCDPAYYKPIKKLLSGEPLSVSVINFKVIKSDCT